MQTAQPASSPRTPWPAGYHGAVLLPFDDGLRLQVETAIPLLDEHMDLPELCAFLARHRDRIWTAPVATVA